MRFKAMVLFDRGPIFHQVPPLPFPQNQYQSLSYPPSPGVPLLLRQLRLTRNNPSTQPPIR
ncbi:hypothetical protein Golob_012374 [Gossypium lobatum]|uniref:Uncharacterized protein n=1 Tax=Gossypium lobatum TaxID=34289 RepID=A0A7J8LL89_9ROSI|nr:hypothetical protein [Gossypium lobatum]